MKGEKSNDGFMDALPPDDAGPTDQRDLTTRIPRTEPDTGGYHYDLSGYWRLLTPARRH